MISTRKITNDAVDDVVVFANKCSQRGFMNNADLKVMKWEWCLENGAWFATYKDNNIISITGVHKFKDGYRALFRGAQLETRPVAGLNRYQMQSYGMCDHLPLQIEFANGLPVYITTNITNDESGRMNRIHKSFSVMAKSDMLTHIGDEEVFYVQQSIWQVNVDRYFEIRSRYV